MIQSILSPCIFSHDLHKIDLKGKTNIDWTFMYRDHLAHWDSREHHIFVADLGVGEFDNYHKWFSSINLRIVGGHFYTIIIIESLVFSLVSLLH